MKPAHTRVRANHRAPDELAPWYVKEWLKHKGRKQADLTRDLGWDPTRTSKLVSGKQPYTGVDIKAVAYSLGIEPFELLMPPKKAHELRLLRETAVAIADRERSERSE